MNTRAAFGIFACQIALLCAAAVVEAADTSSAGGTAVDLQQWETKWEKYIRADSKSRACDSAMGEEIGWLMAPFSEGYYYGWCATGKKEWVENLVDWSDSWIKRAVVEPDGYPGWPKAGAAGTEVDQLNRYTADSMLGEAMALRPITLMAAKMVESPALASKYKEKGREYIKLSERIFEKWDRRGAWRDTKDGGTISVVLPMGIENGKWTGDTSERNAPGHGFSHPNNKANHVARWLLALYDATKKPVYRDRAEKWFRLQKARMKINAGGEYEIWNYWEPAGPWDYKADGSPKHWVGVHPNTGYYVIDTEGIAESYEHGLVFTRENITRLADAGVKLDRCWKALVPYNKVMEQRFLETVKPDSWGGLSAAPWYLTVVRARESAKR